MPSCLSHQYSPREPGMQGQTPLLLKNQILSPNCCYYLFQTQRLRTIPLVWRLYWFLPPEKRTEIFSNGQKSLCIPALVHTKSHSNKTNICPWEEPASGTEISSLRMMATRKPKPRLLQCQQSQRNSQIPALLQHIWISLHCCAGFQSL